MQQREGKAGDGNQRQKINWRGRGVKLSGILWGGAIAVFGLGMFLGLSSMADPPSALDLFPTKREGREYDNPRFSPDGRWLAFDLCENRFIGRECRNVIYDIPNDRYFALRDAEGHPITQISFSADSSQAVFMVETGFAFLGFGKQENQIAIADLNEKHYRFITQGPGYKRYPEFWSNGKVIYIGTEPEDTSRRRNYFLYEVEPGKPPHKLMETSFFELSRARPHWDGKQILKSEFGFTHGGRGEILLIRPVEKSIGVANIPSAPEYQNYFSQPAVARNSQEVYVNALLDNESAQQGLGYRYDVFSFDGNELKHTSRLKQEQIRRRIRDGDVYLIGTQVAKRVTSFGGFIYGIDVTNDGRHLAVITTNTWERRLQDFRLLIYDIPSRTQRELMPLVVQELTLSNR